jgi:hypothetical protein
LESKIFRQKKFFFDGFTFLIIFHFEIRRRNFGWAAPACPAGRTAAASVHGVAGAALAAALLPATLTVAPVRTLLFTLKQNGGIIKINEAMLPIIHIIFSNTRDEKN